jgi:hypothetical protein
MYSAPRAATARNRGAGAVPEHSHGYQQKMFTALWTTFQQFRQPLDVTVILRSARFRAAHHRASCFSLMMD